VLAQAEIIVAIRHSLAEWRNEAYNLKLSLIMGIEDTQLQPPNQSRIAD